MRLLPSLLLACLPACAPPDGDSAAPDTAGAADLDKAPAGLHERLAAGEPVTVLAQLATRDLEPGFEALSGPERRAARAAAYGERMDAVLAGLPAGEFTLERRLRHVPLLPLTLRGPGALAALVEDSRIERVFLEEAHEAHLTQSLAHVDQPEAQALGYGGEGRAVVVLDTGLDYTRAAFGSCTSPGSPAACRVVVAQDFAEEDNARDSGSYHGTNVAGIVAGVAPGADLIGLDVFRSNGYAYSTDIVAAIDWAVDNADLYGIAAINMSLGSGSYASACSGSAYSAAFQSARDAGILPVVSAGNSGYTENISSPACDPDALSVGAVYDANVGGLAWSTCTDTTTAADKVTCFSNSASFLDVLAPGALITAAEITMGGTSQAAPHVAGAVAVVSGAFPGDTADEVQERLVSSGVPVTDSRQGRVLPRLDLDAAVEGAGEEEPLTGAIAISGGAEWATSRSVTLALEASDDVTEVCVSNSASCSAWAAMSASQEWTLSSGNGTKTVYAWFRDAAGSVSAPVSDAIGLDATRPADGSLSVAGGNKQLALSWSGFSDANSGIASYKVVYKTGTSITAGRCTTGVVAYSGTATAVTLTGLTNGATYNLRVCAIDAAGNVSTGPTSSLYPAAEYVAPIGTISINGGAEWTGSPSATVSLSASDASGVSKMCVSTSSACSSWVSYATSQAVTLTYSTGTKTIYAWFKDVNGNVSQVATDAIELDSTRPVNGSASGLSSGGSAALSWSGFSDANSGIASYKVVYKTGTSVPSSSCSNGQAVYQGASLEATHAPVTAGVTYNYRICAIDAVGNASTGSTVSVIAQ